MKKFSSDKHIHQHIKKLIKEGWTFNRRSKHSELRSKDGKQKIFLSVTPSDKRAYMKFKSNLKKMGFVHQRENA